jgi:hypothetical protein
MSIAPARVLIALSGLAVATSVMAAPPSNWVHKLVARTGTISAPATNFGMPNGSNLTSPDTFAGPSIDESGKVYCRWQNTSNNNQGFLVYDPATGTITSTAGQNNTPLYTGWCDSSNGRFVAKVQGTIGSIVVFNADGTVFNNVSLGGPNNFLGSVFNPPQALTDGGVAYLGSIKDSPTGTNSNRYAIDKGSGAGRTQTILASFDFVNTGGITSLAAPVAAGTDMMAGHIKVSTVSGDRDVIARFQIGQPRVDIFSLVTTTGYNAVYDGLGINASGRVAFAARNATGSVWEVRSGDGTGPTTLIASGDGVNFNNANNYHSGSLAPQISGSGLVAFKANNALSGNATPAIYVGDGTGVARVIGVGTVLTPPSGPTVTVGNGTSGSGQDGISGNFSMNGKGQIASIVLINVAGTTTQGLVISTPKCNKADVAQLGGTLGPDGQLTVDDLIAFLGAFFGGDTATADIATLGGGDNPDGVLTVDDLIAFLGFFFSPCN